MAHYVWTLSIQLIFYTNILIVPTTGLPEEPDNVIANFLQNFIKPFLRSANVQDLHNNTTPVKKDTISNLIRRKVLELKPLLQDNDETIETEDNLTLRGNDETTLIEFLPKTTQKIKNGADQVIEQEVHKQDPLKTSINKYKALREQIKEMLDEENVTDTAKKLIITTLDEMIAQLIESQCTWTTERRVVHSHNDTDETIAKLRSMTKKQWKKMRHQYMKYLTDKKNKENAFMNQFHEFFSTVVNDTYNLSGRYKIRCQLLHVGKQEKHKPALRGESTTHTKCENFKLCSDELSEFLEDFYSYLNDTAVSIFTNYASMYVRDVNIDFGVNNDYVVSVLNNLASISERKVRKIYKAHLKEFNLDSNKDREANVIHINDFIKRNVALVKSMLKENVGYELGAMNSKLFLTVKEDLLVNLEVDMENLERHYIDSICTIFVLCNGRYSSRRREGPWTFRPTAHNEMFVNVQLSLDDELKQAVAQHGLIKLLNKRHKYKIHRRQAMPRSMYKYAKVNVTRTTIIIVPSITTSATWPDNSSGSETPIMVEQPFIVANTTQLYSHNIQNVTNENDIAST